MGMGGLHFSFFPQNRLKQFDGGFVVFLSDEIPETWKFYRGQLCWASFPAFVCSSSSLHFEYTPSIAAFGSISYPPRFPVMQIFPLVLFVFTWSSETGKYKKLFVSVGSLVRGWHCKV